MPALKRILILPSWYPENAGDKNLTGIFNRELALALATEHEIETLVLTPSDSGYKAIRNETGKGFCEIALCYQKTGFKPIKIWRQFKALNKYVREAQNQGNKFDLIHVMVAWPAGFLAMLLKFTLRLPYIVTEHYTGYMPADGSMAGFRRYGGVRVLKSAERVVAVSDGLNQVLTHLGVNNVRTIPNIIDQEFYNSVPVQRVTPNIIRWLHISNFDDRQKQTSAIIRAFSLHRHQFPGSTLTLVVPADKYEAFRKTVPGIDFSNINVADAKLSKRQIAGLMEKSDVLISYSRFETFALTVAEAVVSGLPCIYTACGGPEFYMTAAMGRVADAQNEDSLVKIMAEICSNYPFENLKTAGSAREIFNRNSVIEAYSQIYKEAVNS